MTEGPYAQHDGHLFLLTNLNETAQVALPVPAEDALLFLYVIPEDIGGDNGDAAILHLPHSLPPLVSRQARVVYLPHHGADASPVDDETVVVPCYCCPE